MYEGFSFRADFLKQQSTRRLFSKEHLLPSPIIDRGSLRSWRESGEHDTARRAQARVKTLIDNYERPSIAQIQTAALRSMMADFAVKADFEALPRIPELS
jgi:trimethylamine:corrinoid methyltransferase-like protein